MTESRIFYVALTVAVVVFALIHFAPFAGSVPHFVRVSGGGALFDTNIPSSISDVYDRLESYGEEGRKEYVFRNLTTDILLPFAMLPALFLGVRRVNRRFALRTTGYLLLALPFAYVALDIVENLTVISLILNYPERQPYLATALPIVTMLKRFAVFSSLLSLVGGLLASLATPAKTSCRNRTTLVK